MLLRKKPLSLAVAGVLGIASCAGILTSNVYAADQESVLEEIVVTGSRIRKTNLVSSSPVTQVDAAEFLYTGVVRVEDLLNDLPQVFAAQNSGQVNGSTGTATVNLRNLGSVRTLVLMNGRRLPPGSPLAGGIAADVNQVPGGLVERVEVLTGGASAAYGSDAIAGVVNFIMVDDFEGVKFDYQFSQYQHDNDNGRIQRLIADKNFPVPNDDEADGDISNLSVIIGANTADGRGNVTGYMTYRNINAVLQADRDYSGCALGGSPSTFTCGGSSTLPEGRFTDFGLLAGVGPGSFDFIVQGDQFVPRDGLLYNYGPLNYFQRPNERYTGGLFGHYELGNNAEFYTELMFTDNHTDAQIAPSGAFFVTEQLSCGNPFLSAQQFDLICGSFGLTENDFQDIFIGRRNVEGGARDDDIRHTSFRGVFGVRGDINDNWRYDIYGQYSEVTLEQTYFNDLGITKIKRALDVIDVAGVPTCRSAISVGGAPAVDPNCVPWNVFQTGGVTQAALDYLVLPLFARGTTDQRVYSGFVAGDLGDYGIKLPSAETGVSLVVGAEYRSENIAYNPDEGFQLGEGAGQGGPTNPIKGGLDLWEVFMEASIPLVEGAVLAEELTLDLGYRFSDYSTDQTTDTWKVAASWTPVTEVTFRASFQRAIRHANIRELFRPQGIGLFDMATDPCSGPVTGGVTASGRTFEECARSGVTATQFGNIADSPAGQFNEITGGNPDLEPEESDTVSFGFIYQPSWLAGLAVTVDYFDIDVEGAISAVTSEFILTQCLDTGDASFCNAVNRGSATGTLWIGQDHVLSTDINIGFFSTKGVDVIAEYSFDVGEWGSIELANNASFISEWDQQEVPGAPVIDCAGNWGGSCGSPTPEFQNNLRATWFTPWNLTISGNWRHIGEVDDLGSNKADFDSEDYFDLTGIYVLPGNTHTTLRVGFNNIFDEEPPLTSDAGPGLFGNGNTFPGVYDALGRYMFIGLSVDM